MNHLRINELSGRIEKAIAELEKLQAEAANIKCNGQNTVAVSCQGRAIWVVLADRDSGYMAQQVRGMEMILLGLKKYWAGLIDVAQQDLAALREELRKEVTKGA